MTYELGSSLEKLLSTLKKNRENVPLETLKTCYKEPYEALIAQINKTASEFVRSVVVTQLPVNPDVSIDEQVDVINRAIEESGLIRQMSLCMSRTYDVQKLHVMALGLRRKIEDALSPYTAMKNCLVADPENPEKTPVIYNSITGKVYENDAWVEKELDLRGKILLYPMSKQNLSQTMIKEDTNERTNESVQGYDRLPVTAGN